MFITNISFAQFLEVGVKCLCIKLFLKQIFYILIFGAANIMQELLTVKSDDVIGRAKAYEAIVKGEPMPMAGIPESLNVLLHELRGLGLSVNLL